MSFEQEPEFEKPPVPLSKGPEKKEGSAEGWEVFLDNNFSEEESEKIKGLFGNNVEYFSSLTIEKSGKVGKSAFVPDENNIELKETDVDKNILEHELHHALIENKYDILGLERDFLKRFGVRKEDISKIHKLANKELHNKFFEAYDFFNAKGREVMESKIEEKLKKKGMTEKEIRYAVDYYQTQKLLEVQREYREFILSNMDRKFGKEAAEAQKVLFDIKGMDEIIGHALSDTPFGLDLVEYKFVNIQDGSKNVFKMKEKIKEEGYSAVIEKFIGKKVEILEKKLR